ncbi:DUF4256 domain-containing protein [Ravibacter arvi]|uniref:DUF4256 domain-containing protein n=1 Tax=Ravibacter arvi TaxID=2051041 RepID=A0ABP8LUC0_9BACT
MTTAKPLPSDRQKELFSILQIRFEKNRKRHEHITWEEVRAKLEANPGKLFILNEMEETGGEPDVVGRDEKTGEFLFYDCSPETPKGRRSLCFDREALDARKMNKPENSATDMADEIGIKMLTEAEYRYLQTLGEFDAKTSSWVITPPDIRKRGGALFCDRRFGQVFLYHNGADSYYAARGFRGVVKV